MNRDTVIIVAGGTGSRMGADLPKQFLLLDGLPVIFHSINAFLKFDPSIELIIGIAPQYHDHWKNICRVYGFTREHLVSEGGITRTETVRNALSMTSDDEGLVAIHDAARPLVAQSTIEEAFRTAREIGNAVPCIAVSDSFRMTDGETSCPVDRSTLRAVQTPQVFRKSLIKKAYASLKGSEFTDDATVLEAAGEKIFLTQGNQENFKITTPADLNFAGYLSSGRK